MGGTFPMSSERPTIPVGPNRPQPSRPTLQLGPNRPRPAESETETGRQLRGFLGGIAEGMPGAVGSEFSAAGPELLRLLLAGDVNPDGSEQGRFPGMGGRSLPVGQQQRDINREGVRGARRAWEQSEPWEGPRNPESGVGPQFAPSGQRPVNPAAFRAPQGRTADWFNNMPTEQKIGLALMVLSGGMAAGPAAGVNAGGAAVRGGAALLPLILGQ